MEQQNRRGELSKACHANGGYPSHSRRPSVQGGESLAGKESSDASSTSSHSVGTLEVVSSLVSSRDCFSTCCPARRFLSCGCLVNAFSYLVRRLACLLRLRAALISGLLHAQVPFKDESCVRIARPSPSLTLDPPRLGPFLSLPKPLAQVRKMLVRNALARIRYRKAHGVASRFCPQGNSTSSLGWRDSRALESSTSHKTRKPHHSQSMMELSVNHGRSRTRTYDLTDVNRAL